MNDEDDDGVDSSPSETLSKFWAKGSSRLSSENQFSERSRSDFIGVVSYQNHHQVKSNGPGKSDDQSAVRNCGNLQKLSHTAAKHKISVRPRRNHPSKRKRQVESNCNNTDHTTAATVNHEESGGGGNDPFKQTSFSVVTNSNMKDTKAGRLRTWDQKVKSKPEHQQQEKLYKFFSKLIGSKKAESKQSSPCIPLQQNVTNSSHSSTNKHNPRTRTKKKPPPPPPPPSSDQCRPQPPSMNVSPELAPPAPAEPVTNVQNWLKYKTEETKSPDFTTFSNVPLQSSQEQNVIMKRNNSLGCLLSLEQSHERFQTSIQSWSLANEGFLKSLGSFPDKKLVSSTEPLSSVSNDSLMSVSSLIGEDSMLDEPDCMEQTSLMVFRHGKVRHKAAD